MIEVAIGLVAVGFAVMTIATKYLDLLDHREERAHRVAYQRTADVAAIATKADDVEAALLKHEERICAMEMTVAGAPARRRP